MKYFFFSILESISSLEFYKKALQSSLGQMLRFYLLFMILVVAVLSAHYWLDTKPKYQQYAETVFEEVARHYPSDLVISWDGRELRSTETPLTIPFPTSLPKNLNSLSEHLLIITSEPEPVPQESTLFIATPTHLYTANQGQVSQGVALADLLGEDNMYIDQDTAPSFLETTTEQTAMLLNITGYVFPAVSYIFLVSTSLVLLVFDTAVIFLFIKLQQLSISYKQLLQLGLAVLIPAQIIELVTVLANLDVPISMLSLSFWILFIVVFFSLKRS